MSFFPNNQISNSGREEELTFRDRGSEMNIGCIATSHILH
jgi:hypothetical protein